MYEKKTVQETCELLGTDLQQGLTSQQAKERLENFMLERGIV